MRHWIAGVPARAELALFAWEEDGELRGWATRRVATGGAPIRTAGSWRSPSTRSRRGEGIGTALAEAADEHLGRLGVRTTRAGSLDEPGARALAARRGFDGARRRDGLRSRSAHRRAPPDPRRRRARPVRGHRRPGARSTSSTWSSPATSRTRTTTRSSSRSGRPTFWQSPLIDDDASLVALVDGQLAGLTMIRIDRPERPRAEQPLRRPAAVSRPRAGAPPQVPQPPSRRGARRDDRPHRQRRDERADARGEPAARLRAVRPPSRVGAGCRYQLTVSSMCVPKPDGRATRKVYVPGGSGSNEPLQ